METKHTRVGAFAAARYSDGSQVMIAVSAAHAFLCRKIFLLENEIVISSESLLEQPSTKSMYYKLFTPSFRKTSTGRCISRKATASKEMTSG
jgi:hypothetical protein